MTFLELFPEYETYDEARFKSVPDGMGGKLRAYILTRVTSDKGLQGVCNAAAAHAHCEPTDNWGRDYLKDDLRGYMDKLVEGKFHKFMDFASWFATQLIHDRSVLQDLNELFESCDFGYRLDEELGPRAWWRQVEPATATTAVIEESIVVLEAIPQVKLHLQQAKEHIKKADEDRSRKDALRDCLSAMESVVKYVTGKEKFDAALKELFTIPGLKSEIAKEPNRIWNWIHDLYPDVRHGSPKQSEISKAEAEYWIDRVLATTNLLAKLHQSRDV